jgi:hypothetical protein
VQPEVVGAHFPASPFLESSGPVQRSEVFYRYEPGVVGALNGPTKHTDDE